MAVSAVEPNGNLVPEKILHPDEINQYRQLPEYSREDWLSGRAAVKHAYKSYLMDQTLELSQIEIANRRSGRPFIVNDTGVFCSISHSRGQAVAAVTSHPIGVDMEKIRPHTNEIVDYIAEQGEWDVVAGAVAHVQSEVCVTTIWTVKEAVMKALGVGFGISPKSVTIYNYHGNSLYSVMAHLGTRRLKWYVYGFIRNGFCFSIASQFNYAKTELGWVDWSRLSTPAAPDYCS